MRQGVLVVLSLVCVSCTHDFGRFEPDEPTGGRGGAAEHCDNGVLDAFTETDVDCGGACDPCERGAECREDDDCETDHCADDTCCESACNGANRSCDRPGREGECVTGDR